MKKLIIIHSILCMAFVGFSQASAQSMKPRFGIKAGANVTTLGKYEVGGSAYDYDHQFGFQGGVYADLPISSQLSFMPQVLYSQKGGRVKATVGTTTGELKSKLNYLDVPLLIGFKPVPEFTVFAGPQIAFLLSQTTDTYVNGAATSNTSETKDLRKSVIGGNVGVGYNVTNNVNISANYTMDFNSIANDNINQSKTRNSGFGLALGYTF